MTRTRRTFLTDLGRTSLGLVVVGSVGCTGGDPVVEVPEGTPRPASGSSPLLVDLDFVAAYVVVRDGTATVIDTGIAGSEGAIEQVLVDAGSGWSDVGDVILTHSHGDHAGSLPAVAALAPDATLHAGAADIPDMSAPRAITPAEDGTMIAGLQVVATPGHTPGHISLFDPTTGALYTGDALVGAGGQVAGPDPQFTADMAAATASVAALAELPVEQILVCHGFPVDGGQAELAALAAGR